MIYLDNAATTRLKPDCVYDAFMYYAKDIAVSPGRGSYSIGIEASRMLYKTRKNVGDFFGLKKTTNVLFTKNSTEAINLFCRGFLHPGDHVVITCYEHNSVLRPLHKMKQEGIIDYSVIQREDLLLSPEEIYVKYFSDKTCVFMSTLASNLTGRILFNPELNVYLKSKDITVFIDASQGAGKIKINMNEDGVDFLAFTGHKDLLALPGVGGLCCNTNPENIEPLLQGGTGIFGDSYINPPSFPDGYEAGTLNMPAIWALNASIDYVRTNFSTIVEKENELKEYLLEKLRTVDNIIIYDDKYERVPTVGFNIENRHSDKLVTALDKNNICVRGGVHCAVLAHEALETLKTGVVRVSLSYNNTKSDIDELIMVLRGEI